MLLCLLLAPLATQGQDIHFSKTDINPVLLNPAYAGFFDGKGRFGLAYRDQWASVSRPFQTLAATAEVALLRRRYQRDGLSLGCLLYADREGTLQYGNTAANLIVSYFKALGNKNFLSVGIEGGYGSSGFDLSEASFFEEGDDIALTGRHYPLLGVGVAWNLQPSDLFGVRVGVAARNLNRPNISYTGLDSVFLHRHFSLYARAEYRYRPNLSLLPLATLQWQKNYSEYLMGMEVKWYVHESRHEQLAFSAGMAFRWRDALNIMLSMDYNAFMVNLCYDINVSKLATASRSIGALEVQLVYLLNRASTVKHKALPCPII